jgi:hypothetical protein
LSAAAMPFKLVIPAARSSATKVTLEAERKTARDARYAARKARKR